MAEDVNKKKDGGKKQSTCFPCDWLGTFVNFVFLRCLLLTLYTLDISSDIAVSYGDYMAGSKIFSFITLGLVFCPGIFLSSYMICDSFWRFPGGLACLKSIRWILVCPFLPLWPIFRGLKQILMGLKATIFPDKRKLIIKELNCPSRSYLLKYLEAFTEAAPQLVVRLLKMCLNNPFPFVGFRKSEITQISLSLFVLSLTVISTHQKNVSTKQIMDGELESINKYSLTCIGQIFALIWWLTFILTRIQAIVLFTSAFHYWIFLLIGIHIGLMFIIQTIATAKETMRKIFIYFFGAFVFIFAYVQFNLTSKVKVGAWVSYIIFTIVVFVENIIMLTCWLYKQNSTTNVYITEIQNMGNGTDTNPDYFPSSEIYTHYSFTINSHNDTEVIRESINYHTETLLFIHYGLFSVSLLFMTLTFMCPFTNQNGNINDGDEEEMTQFNADK